MTTNLPTMDEIELILDSKRILEKRIFGIRQGKVLVLPRDKEELYKQSWAWKVLCSNFTCIRFTRDDRVAVIMTERGDSKDLVLYPLERYEFLLEKV